jgi:hypothetical protein
MLRDLHAPPPKNCLTIDDEDHERGHIWSFWTFSTLPLLILQREKEREKEGEVFFASIRLGVLLQVL